MRISVVCPKHLAIWGWLGGIVMLFSGGIVQAASPSGCGEGEAIAAERRQYLIERLHAEGFAKPWLKQVFDGAKLCSAKQAVRFNVFNPERISHYRQFTEAYAINLAHRFLRKQRGNLAAAEKRYHVPATIITAILLAETAFGRAALRYSALNVFVSLAVLDPRQDLQAYWTEFRTHQPNLERKWLQLRLEQKSRFGYNQLTALLKLNGSRPAAIRHIRSSYAGALGIPQFLPTSQLQWSIDGNQDGTVNLNHIHDAIASVAYYLNQHGWKRNTTYQQRWKAVWGYNHSSDYVNTIFEISKLLEAK